MEDGPESKKEIIEDDDASEEIPINRVKKEEDFETEEDELERLSAEAQDDFGDDDEEVEKIETMVEEPAPKKVDLETAVANSYSGREHVYKNRAFYAFRYVIMLLSGGSFIASLISIISLTISKWVNEDFRVSYWSGPVFANMVTMVAVLGLIHLLMSLTVGKNWKPEDGEKRRYPAVLSVIYSVGLGAAAITYLVVFLGTLIGSMLELNSAKGTDILELFLISLAAIIILVFALAYKLDLFKKMQKAVYVFIMGVIAIVGVVLFLVFPAKEVRDAVHDNNVIEDLEKIESAIDDYYYSNNKMPSGLQDLTAKLVDSNESAINEKDLNYSLNSYKYTDESVKSRYYSSGDYKICAVFKTDATESDSSYNYYSIRSSYYYGYYYHPKGEYCFERSAYGGSIVNNYDYDDRSYNDLGEDDITAGIKDALDDYNTNSDGSCTEVEITKDGVKCADSDDNDEDEYDWSWLEDDDTTAKKVES